jgi:hypothetical protein
VPGVPWGYLMETMAAWFGLRDGHRDFTIENNTHAELLFARQALGAKLKAILQRAFRTDNPPKFVLYGDWGVGKTHTLRHVEYDIATNSDYPATTVFVELPDITKKSTFQVAHAAFLDALGIDRAKQWMAQYQIKHQTHAFGQIQDHTQSGDIAKAFATLPGFGDSARTAWDWLRGISLSAADARGVGLPPALEQSSHMTAVLRMLGLLSRDVEDKLLVFMLDEAEKVEFVTDGDAIQHWRSAFTDLADSLNKDVGLVIAASFRNPDDMPGPLADQLMLDNLDPDATRDFVAALLDAWVEPERKIRIGRAHADEADGEVISAFPFTEEGMAGFVDHACRNGAVSTPRDIQKTLDDILNRAIDDHMHIVSSVYLDTILSGV